MELKQLEAFVNVVELQSFSKAAQKLYLTQPTISSHIVSLEKEFNTKFLERTTKNVQTTVDGERLYEYAKEIMAIKEELYQGFGKEREEEQRIQIAGSTIPSQYILPELIQAFQKQHDKVCFTINQGDSEHVVGEILKHRAVIGFVGIKSKDDRLRYIPFYEDKLVLVTPNEKHYQELLNRNCSFDDLIKEPIILRENGSGTKKTAEKFLESKKVDIQKLNVVAYINDQEIIKKSVSRGMGITIMSKKAAQDYVEDGKILMYEPDEEEVTRKLYIVYAKRKKLDRLAKKFIEFCCQFYA
ncbi:selenium metabolism-associated LysR family transcriptional regulator [Lachnoclostridium phytofermentans]|jgi:DNA-binding transcriptional LysR family regulator|uniref:selenium metabolism-associated LysR family transcriptional regulator n=1 Tax=Lachnoclostridium phytofermentans TaxID=66219 RepID=UPI0004970A77|nr:selenium metabolism-associated LysR family transcriptional regulator [Lachnoclostridium phytofermentans]